MADTELETHEPLQSPGATLADEMYGKPEPEPEPVKEDPEVAEKPEVEVADVEVEDPPSLSLEIEDESEVEVQTLEQLAEHLETDPDWLKNLKVTEKVNGKEVEVSLSDALATHRKVAAGDDYLADAKAKAKDLISSADQEKQVVASSAATLSAILQEVEAEIDGDMKAEDWAKLRRDDPAEYSAKKEEIRERRARLDDMKQRAMAAFSETTTKLTEKQKAAREASVPKEYEIFLQMVPEWKDESVAQKESTEITEYLTKKGHTPEEIEVAAYNGKLLAYVRNSMLYERSKGKIDLAKKKVTKIPKITKPGTQTKKQKPTDGPEDRVSILYG